MTGFHHRAAREALAEAWAHREALGRFLELELDLVRCLLEAGDRMVSVLLLNTVAAAYAELPLAMPVPVPVWVEYRPTYAAVIDALEAGEAARARATLGAFLEAWDDAFMALIPGSSREG